MSYLRAVWNAGKTEWVLGAAVIAAGVYPGPWPTIVGLLVWGCLIVEIAAGDVAGDKVNALEERVRIGGGIQRTQALMIEKQDAYVAALERENQKQKDLIEHHRDILAIYMTGGPE